MWPASLTQLDISLTHLARVSPDSALYSGPKDVAREPLTKMRVLTGEQAATGLKMAPTVSPTNKNHRQQGKT
jgi:hypothetical protein